MTPGDLPELPLQRLRSPTRPWSPGWRRAAAPRPGWSGSRPAAAAPPAAAEKRRRRSEDAQHEQRGRDRPADEGCPRCSFAGAPAAPHLAVRHGLRRTRRYWPLVTTALPRRQACLDDGDAVRDLADLHRPHGRPAVGVDGVDEVAAGPALQRGRRDGERRSARCGPAPGRRRIRPARARRPVGERGLERIVPVVWSIWLSRTASVPSPSGREPSRPAASTSTVPAASADWTAARSCSGRVKTTEIG